MNKTQRVLAGAVVVLVAILGYFAWKERGSAQVPTEPLGLPTTSAPVSINVGASSAANSTSTSGYTIRQITVPAPSKAVAPDYKTPLSCAKDVAADICTSMQAPFTAAQAAIEANPNDFNAWIALGLYRKEAGDYTGASADWEYMSKLYPANTVSFADLGDLYTNYLPNYPKAAAAYKQEIANDPTLVYIYLNLFNLYTHQYPQSSTTAEAVLRQGIAANPSNSAQLQAALSAYQTSQGK